jgi:hypothetical protein
MAPESPATVAHVSLATCRIESFMDSHLIEGCKRKKPRRITALQPNRSALNMLMMKPKDSSAAPRGHLDITPNWDDIQIYIITC